VIIVNRFRPFVSPVITHTCDENSTIIQQLVFIYMVNDKRNKKEATQQEITEQIHVHAESQCVKRFQHITEVTNKRRRFRKNKDK
jgi:hypothetical protein